MERWAEALRAGCAPQVVLESDAIFRRWNLWTWRISKRSRWKSNLAQRLTPMADKFRRRGGLP